MEIVFYIGCCMFGLGLGAIIAETLMMNKCKHDYKLITEGDIKNLNRYGQEIVVGFIKVYECEHCKDLKTNKVWVNK